MPASLQKLVTLLHSPAILWLAVAYELWSLVSPAHSSLALGLSAVNLLVYRLLRYILLNPRALTTAWLRSGFLIFMGSISYSMYMFHTILIALYDEHVRASPLQIFPFLIRFLVVTLATLLLCVTVRRLVEVPALSLRKWVVR